MKKYNIGLDIGTTSVGWAVVESQNQKVIRKGKGNERKALWGVRLFEEGSTAEVRRNFRSTRRRYDRRRNRIQLLQEEFKNEINKVDLSFFRKLKESKYNEKDIINKKIIIGNDEKIKIKKYNDKYKTIYHLRNRLITDKSKEDIRLVYLAIHHIIKYRGNFNYSGATFNTNKLDIKEKLINVFDILRDNFSNLSIPDDYQEYISVDNLSKILLDDNKNDIKINLKKELDEITTNKNFVNEFVKLICGNKFNIKKFFMLENIESTLTISFDGTDLEDNYNELENTFDAEIIESLLSLRELYDALFLKKVFKGGSNTSISSLMVERYNQHKEDLEYLKELLSFDRKVYNKFFRTKKEICYYDKYIHNDKEMTYEKLKNELLKYIPVVFEKINPNHPLVTKYTISENIRIANDEFLPRITDVENGKYPYQLNEMELIQIIENQGQYYPFLLEKIENEYKIVKILKFKIPYYVGPLVSNKRSEFAWMERKIDNVKITPYNFDDVVDKELTAENFIKRMISHCTYLLKEYALPNNSILYSKYKVLNELKQIKVNNEKLTLEQQQRIITDLFMKNNGAITDTKFKKYLHSCYDFSMYGIDINVTGYSADGKFANNMQSYYDFFGENGIFEGLIYNEKDAENIIEWITIFEDKDILEKKVRKAYPKLNDEKVNKILNKKYSGWGNLSKKLLETAYYEDEKTHVKKSILDLMYETNENFMQIINNDKYKFQNMIKENNTLLGTTKLSYEMVSELTTSPANKRGIYQALKVVDEIVSYMGYDPEYIVIEMARNEDNNKRRKDNRVKYLLKLYETAKEITEDYNNIIKNLKIIEKEEQKFDEEKIYLYYLQEGKCLYCGKSIDISSLNGNYYEIDHILPRTLIKDNSFDNKALVCREHNQEKADSFIIPAKFRNNETVKKLWERLKKNGLMTSKKMYRLTRKEYNDEDIKGFINRQIVETRQITKHVANIISNLHKNSKVIYIKSSYSHDYRNKYELYKFRELNDYHHAHDAYLAAVLGEYKEKYLNSNINFEFVKKMNEKLKKLDKENDLIYGYPINCLDEDVNDIIYGLAQNMIDKDTGEVLFEPLKFNKNVADTLYRNDILISRKTEIRSGQFFKQSILEKGKGNIRLKKNMPTDIYGGYTSVENSYLSLIKYKNKMKLIGIPLQIAQVEKKDKNIKYEFIMNHLKLKSVDDFEIIKDKIPFETLCNYKGQEVYIKGYSTANKNCELSNAYQLKLSKKQTIKWKEILNYVCNNKKIKLNEEEINGQFIELINYLYSCKEKYPLFKKDISKIEDNICLDTCSIDELSKITTELLKIYHCNSVNGNLKDFGLGDRIGRLSGFNVDNDNFKFKSTTGIKEV